MALLLLQNTRARRKWHARRTHFPNAQRSPYRVWRRSPTARRARVHDVLQDASKQTRFRACVERAIFVLSGRERGELERYRRLSGGRRGKRRWANVDGRRSAPFLRRRRRHGHGRHIDQRRERQHVLGNVRRSLHGHEGPRCREAIQSRLHPRRTRHGRSLCRPVDIGSGLSELDCRERR
jgi:hypothetical protein